MTRGLAFLLLTGLFGIAGALPAAAQPLGVFSWQLQPYCNRLTVAVTQNGTTFTLDGFDDQCGSATRAATVGTAFPNPDGSVGIGLVIVATPGGAATHVDATVNLATLNGSWRDGAGRSGTFVYAGAGGGPQRPLHNAVGPLEVIATTPMVPELQLTGVATVPDLLSVRTGGTPNAPNAVLNGDTLLRLDAAGHTGTRISGSRASIRIDAAENWTPSANGTTLRLMTTASGSTAAATRLYIAPTGNVGIGVAIANDRLHVAGNIRVGTGTLGCVRDSDGTLIAGTCASDARFKRDIVPFAPVLSRVTRLRPVTFAWRADAFPDQAFGTGRSFGLVAQDVEAVMPELVAADEDGYKAVRYSELPLIAIQAIRELAERNDALERRLEALERRLAATP